MEEPSNGMAVDGGRGKRKQQPEEDGEPGSPTTVLTMAGMQTLLAAHLGTQTRELQAHQTAEIGKAVKAMEERTNRQIEHVRKEMQKEVRAGRNANAEAIEKLQESQDRMEKRLAALENREPSTAASTDAGDGRRQAIILGGWARGTPKMDILSAVKAMALDLDINAQLGDYFVPGQRNSGRGGLCGPRQNAVARGQDTECPSADRTPGGWQTCVGDAEQAQVGKGKSESYIENKETVVHTWVGCSPVRPRIFHGHPVGKGQACGQRDEI